MTKRTDLIVPSLTHLIVYYLTHLISPSRLMHSCLVIITSHYSSGTKLTLPLYVVPPFLPAAESDITKLGNNQGVEHANVCL